jgi:hypothetical protein
MIYGSGIIKYWINEEIYGYFCWDYRFCMVWIRLEIDLIEEGNKEGLWFKFW